MPKAYNITSAAPTELLVVGDVKRYLRISHASEDEDLARWITAARVAVEAHTGLAVGDRALTFYRSKFPPGRDPLSLPMAPANSLTSVNYLDEDEASQSIAVGVVSLRNTDQPELVPDSEWPGTSVYHNDAVTIVYDGGYTAATAPPGIKMAMLHYVAAAYEYRGETGAAEETFFSLLAPYVQGDEFTSY
jgi:uncharacterized phiE125 gp8 family phage protein